MGLPIRTAPSMPSLVEYKGYRSCHARKLAQGHLPYIQPSRVRSGLRICAVLSMPSLVEYKVIVEVMLESWRRVAYCLYNHRGSGRACAAAWPCRCLHWLSTREVAVVVLESQRHPWLRYIT